MAERAAEKSKVLHKRGAAAPPRVQKRSVSNGKPKQRFVQATERVDFGRD